MLAITSFVDCAASMYLRFTRKSPGAAEDAPFEGVAAGDAGLEGAPAGDVSGESGDGTGCGCALLCGSPVSRVVAFGASGLATTLGAGSVSACSPALIV